MGTSWTFRLPILLALAAVILFVAQQPFSTSDGPVHLGFSDRIAHLSQPERELQRQAYETDLRLTPNLASYLLMVPLLSVASAPKVESFIQIICLFGPTLAAWFALRAIRPQNAWLAIFLIPLALNQAFFLGLYSLCISSALIFVSIGCYWRLVQSPTPLRAGLLGIALNLTMLAHAAGYISAAGGILAMTATRIVISWCRDRSVCSALGKEKYVLFALAISLPLLVYFMTMGGSGPTEYGPGLVHRLSLLRLVQLRMTGGIDALAGLLLSLLLLGLLAWTVGLLLKQKSGLPQDLDPGMISALVAFGASIAVLLVFPDTMGGGWTHIRRFSIVPFYWVVVFLAFQRYSPAAKVALASIVGVVSVTLYATTSSRELTVREQMVPFAAIDHAVGQHCTLMPIMLESRPLTPAGEPMDISYGPFYQAANRLELAKDRLVLFNFLARLDVYPVKYRETVEPQANLFRWEPRRQDPEIQVIDIPNFERVSGLHIDYILVRGQPSRQSINLRKQVADALSGAALVYETPIGPISLYRRPLDDESRSKCVR